MSKKNIIKKDLLRRKIQEYFTKNPSAKSVIIKTDIGDAKTLWKVVREGASFRIVEVNTKKEEFIIESGIAIVKEASVEFSNLSRLFVQAMTPPFDHAKLSNALRSANASINRIVDPKEKNEVGAMIGALTNMVDVTTAGGGSRVQTQTQSRPVTTLGNPPLKEEEDKDKDKEKDKEEKPTKPKKKEPPKATGKLEPTEEPDEDVGLETDADLEEPQPDLPSKQPSSEEMVVGQSLSGQSIKAANIQLTPGGGKLTLDLVSAAMPAELEWSKTGKVIFTFNGRPYVLKRD